LVAVLALLGAQIATIDTGAARLRKHPFTAGGAIGCSASGSVRYRGPLFANARTGRSVVIKATLACFGTTGNPELAITGGRLVATSSRFTGSCSAPNPRSMTGSIKWTESGRDKVEDTTFVAGAPTGTSTNPYRYDFSNFTIRGSYHFQRGALRIASATTRAACGARGLRRWNFTGTFTSSLPALRATSLGAGPYGVCAVNLSGAAECWGLTFLSGNAGIAGVPPGLGSGVAAADAGERYYMCARTTGGAARCLSQQDNSEGQLGNGTFTYSPGLSQVVGLTSGVTDISAGGFSACAVTAAGGVVCWGKNTSGQLGNGTFTNASAPVPVLGLSSGVVGVSIGEGHGCAVLQNGSASCWGTGYSGQLGRVPSPGINHPSPIPMPVVGLAGSVVKIRVADLHTCALLSNGRVQCWGLARGLPTTIPNITTAVDVAVGARHACAVLAGGAVRCWGNNEYGQVGTRLDRTRYSNFVNPVTVPGLSPGAVEVAASGDYSCARLADNTVRCWGSNWNSALGANTGSHSYVPMVVVT
jgi:alpha-tubulin suppressor-like RCC1 family protein